MLTSPQTPHLIYKWYKYKGGKRDDFSSFKSRQQP
jgi:hypothetical protein